MNNRPVTFNIGANIGKLYDLNNKEQSVSDYVAYMLCRTHSMFRYTGLPDTIPERDFCLMLQTLGFVCIPKASLTGGKLYALRGGLGGEPNPYYMPTICTVANPALDFSASLKIGEDCFIIPHDTMYMGLLPLLSRYATQLVENDISIRVAQIMTRVVDLITASDDASYNSAIKFLQDIEAGKLGAIGASDFMGGIDVHNPAQGQQSITPLIELQQYLKAGWYNDIGLNANYNMKRESINSNEAQLNDDALLPFVDDIYNTQKKAFEKMNAAWGTNFGIEYNSAWEDTQKETEREVVENENS